MSEAAFPLLDLADHEKGVLIGIILFLGPWGSVVLRRTCKQLRGITNDSGFRVGLLDVPYLRALPAWEKQGDVCSLLTVWRFGVHGPSRLRCTIDQPHGVAARHPADHARRRRLP